MTIQDRYLPGDEPAPHQVSLWRSHRAFRCLLVAWTVFMTGAAVYSILDEPRKTVTWVWVVATLVLVAVAWWAATTLKVYDRR